MLSSGSTYVRALEMGGAHELSTVAALLLTEGKEAESDGVTTPPRCMQLSSCDCGPVDEDAMLA